MSYDQRMSTDANLVLATPDEMRAACPGYREALAEPVTLTLISPITLQPQQIESWDPQPFAPFPVDARERWIKALRAFATQARDQGRRIFAIVTES